MPKTYSMNLNHSLDEKINRFISTLQMVSYQNSGPLFDKLQNSPDISFLELINSNGAYVKLPSTIHFSENISEIVQAELDSVLTEIAISAYEDSPAYIAKEYPDAICMEDTIENYQNYALAGTLETATTSYNTEAFSMQSYNLSFLGSEENYTLLVYANAQPVSQIKEVFLQIMPILFFLTIGIAIFAALLFSYIVTKPILRISSIAQKMSQLSLDWHFNEKRNDELGILEKSLNTLSKNLSLALTNLQAANHKLQEDIEKEQQFFSAVSHELKTPITVIKGQLEGMLFDIGAYKDHKKYLARSLAVTNTLETMVQEILTVSRLETNALKHSQFDISQTIKSCLLSTEDLIINKELTLHTDLEPSAIIIGNKMLLAKVIGNLISNAIFYSPIGSEIFLTTKFIDGHFLFQIENTGAHIPEEALPKLFEAFYRVDQSRNRQTGGSGLGLYIVQKVLEQHHSYCTAKNTEKGVCFSFQL